MDLGFTPGSAAGRLRAPGCITFPLCAYERERLKSMKRLRQVPALKLFDVTACKSDLHVRGTALFPEGNKSL